MADPAGAPGTSGTAEVVVAVGLVESPGFAGKWWFWLPWPLLVALDLWSKAVVFEEIRLEAIRLGREYVPENHRPDINVFDGPLRFDLVSWGNKGTIWGLFQNGTIPLMVLRCVAVVGLFWFLRRTARTAALQQFVLSLVLAGALGNLYDNFVRADRSVRDFLRFTGTWPWTWEFPAFNVADSCITVGAIGLFLLLWWEDRTSKGDRVS